MGLRRPDGARVYHGQREEWSAYTYLTSEAPLLIDMDLAFTTNWKCLIGIGPPASSLGRSDFTVVHDTRYSFLLIAQPQCTFFFVLFFLDKPFPAHKRVYYTEDDAELLAATVADHPITESLVFGDLWKNRTRGALISLEEGVLEHWHYGRIVLSGDAVHKVR